MLFRSIDTPFFQDTKRLGGGYASVGQLKYFTKNVSLLQKKMGELRHIWVERCQKIHKEKQKNFRVYKNFLFGGLIKCEECGSNMTSCFTNKYSKNELNRYYYYRCTSTTKFDWQSCSVKQVSAERLENFCQENLERISIDKSYIDNLVFRLNHEFEAGYRDGHELSASCSKISSESISDTLKFFINRLKTTKGIERKIGRAHV